MTPRTKVILLWSVLGTCVAAIALLLARPLAVGWQCYWLYEYGDRQQAVVLHKLDNATFALHIKQGPDAGESCTADTSLNIYEGTEVGDTLEVVRLESKPGECELTTTIYASAQMLWIISGGVGLVVVGLFALGGVLTRSFTQSVVPKRRIEIDPREVRCPACEKRMDEGYLAVLSGIHWRNAGEPIGLPNALSGLPGTVGWRGRPTLHGFRCVRSLAPRRLHRRDRLKFGPSRAPWKGAPGKASPSRLIAF
jgi:hypothetical protein